VWRAGKLIANLGNNNKLNWVLDDKQELIDIIETIYKGAKKGRGLVVSPKGEYNSLRLVLVLSFRRVLMAVSSRLFDQVPILDSRFLLHGSPARFMSWNLGKCK
jgi:hypothetical protein